MPPRAPRMERHACMRSLRADGEKHGRKRIARLMRMAGLVGASRRRAGVTTTRRDKEARPAPDLVDRNFVAVRPNQLWVADITFGTDGKWVSLSCRGPRCMEPQDRRLVYGEPPARRTGGRCTRNGHWSAPSG